jgi:hypothetical protein
MKTNESAMPLISNPQELEGQSSNSLPSHQANASTTNNGNEDLAYTINTDKYDKAPTQTLTKNDIAFARQWVSAYSQPTSKKKSTMSVPVSSPERHTTTKQSASFHGHDTQYPVVIYPPVSLQGASSSRSSTSVITSENGNPPPSKAAPLTAAQNNASFQELPTQYTVATYPPLNIQGSLHAPSQASTSAIPPKNDNLLAKSDNASNKGILYILPVTIAFFVFLGPRYYDHPTVLSWEKDFFKYALKKISNLNPFSPTFIKKEAVTLATSVTSVAMFGIIDKKYHGWEYTATFCKTCINIPLLPFKFFAPVIIDLWSKPPAKDTSGNVSENGDNTAQKPTTKRKVFLTPLLITTSIIAIGIFVNYKYPNSPLVQYILSPIKKAPSAIARFCEPLVPPLISNTYADMHSKCAQVITSLRR